MSTTLSKLVEYLSEKLHCDKCTDYKYHLDYMLLPSNYSSWWRRLEDILKTSWSRRIFRLSFTSSEDVFKTSSKLFQDVLPRCLQEVFKTSSRRLAKTSSRHLQDVFKTFWRHLRGILQRYLQDIFKIYH